MTRMTVAGLRSAVRYFCLLFFATLMVACGGGGGGGSGGGSGNLGGGGGGSTVTLLRIEVSPATLSLAAGTTQPLVATAIYSNGTSQTVTSTAMWTSAAPATATVGNSPGIKGLVRGTAVGSTTVTATFETKTATVPVTVTAATPSSLTITPNNPTVGEGSTRQLTATMIFTDGTSQNVSNDATWVSAAPAIATVSATGLVTAIDPGTAVVSAEFMSLTDTTTVTVSAAFVTAVAVTPTNPTIPRNGTQQFTAMLTFSDNRVVDGTNDVTWLSTLPGRATVSNTVGTKGLAAGVAAGTTTIRATAAGGAFGQTALTVSAAGIQSISVTPAVASVAAGFERPFQATATLTDGSTREVTQEVVWGSSAPNFATISNAAGTKGIATGVAAGRTTITATSGTIQGSTTLDVTGATLNVIQVTPAMPSVALGLEQQFVATGVFSDLTTSNLTTRVTWASSDVSVATISNADGTRGLASTESVGTTTITAALGSTSGTTVLTVSAATLTAIEVTPKPGTVAKGLTLQFTATGTFTDDVVRDVTQSVVWTSSSPAIATISNDTVAMSQGLATGVTIGNTTITATQDAVSSTAQLNVTAAVLQSIAVTPATPDVPLGTAQAFTATGTYSDSTTANITPFVTWASSDTAIATISNTLGSRGRATTLALGTTTISATSPGTDISDSTVMTVVPVELVSITVTPADSAIANGTSTQLTATGNYSNGTTRVLTTEVTWASDDPAVVTISNDAGTKGRVTSAAVGSVRITAVDPATMVSGETGLTVLAAVLSSIRVEPVAATLPVGFSLQFTAIGVYSDDSEQDLTTQVTWSSLPLSVAFVSNAETFKGIVTGVAAGTATIVASTRSETGAAVSGNTSITISAATLTSIAVTPGTVSRTAGSTQQFVATGTFSDGTTMILTEQVTWSSSAPTVATISDTRGTKGLATVVPGLIPIMTTITATRGVGPISGTATLTRGLL